MIDGLLLQTVEGLENGIMVRAGDEVWERLLGEKQDLATDLLAEGPLCQSEVGAYGRCADCGWPIDSQRLQAVPEATLCTRCQRNTEPEVACCTL